MENKLVLDPVQEVYVRREDSHLPKRHIKKYCMRDYGD